MPQPTKEQFDAAAQKVMASAPPGLSREAFFAEIDKELAKSPLQQANETPLKEATTYDEGFSRSLKDTALKTGKGIVEGLNPINTLKGFVQAVKDKPQREADWIAGKKQPGSILDDIKSLSDPETGGRTIGGLSQGLILGGVSRLPLRSIAASGLDTAADVVSHPALTSAKGIRSIADKIRPAASSPVVPLAEDLGPGAVLRGTDQFGGRAYGFSPGQPKPPMPMGNITGKAPALEDVLTKIIDEIRAGDTDPARASTLPESSEPTGGGIQREITKLQPKPKSRVTGYSSGTPAISAEDAAQLGGRGVDVPGEVSSPSSAEAPAPAAEVTSQQAFEARKALGSRDAAAKLFGSATKANIQKIIDLTPGYKAGTIPSEVQSRMLDAELLRQLEEDQ